MPRPSAFDNFPEELRCDYGPHMGVIDDWHDGDTCKVVFDPGFDEEPCRWIRLKGVSAAELWTTEGASLLEWVKQEFKAPLPIRCETEKTPRAGTQVMSFTRYVGTLYCSRAGELVNINYAISDEIDRRASGA